MQFRIFTVCAPRGGCFRGGCKFTPTEISQTEKIHKLNSIIVLTFFFLKMGKMY